MAKNSNNEPNGQGPGNEDPSQRQRKAVQLRPADLPEDLRAKIENAVKVGSIQIVVESSYQGPLPPPDLMKSYNDALPDGANRIVTAWEKQGQHRRTLETRGQRFALTIASAAIAAAVWTAILGHPWLGGGIVISAMVAIGMTGVLNLYFHSGK